MPEDVVFFEVVEVLVRLNRAPAMLPRSSPPDESDLPEPPNSPPTMEARSRLLDFWVVVPSSPLSSKVMELLPDLLNSPPTSVISAGAMDERMLETPFCETPVCLATAFLVSASSLPRIWPMILAPSLRSAFLMRSVTESLDSWSASAFTSDFSPSSLLAFLSRPASSEGAAACRTDVTSEDEVPLALLAALTAEVLNRPPRSCVISIDLILLIHELLLY